MEKNSLEMTSNVFRVALDLAAQVIEIFKLLHIIHIVYI